MAASALAALLAQQPPPQHQGQEMACGLQQAQALREEPLQAQAQVALQRLGGGGHWPARGRCERALALVSSLSVRHVLLALTSLDLRISTL